MMFDKEIYVNRRKVLKDNIKQGLILLLGNDESPMNYPDNPYYFRQHSTFLYYLGLDIPSLAAVLDLDNDTEIIFGDELSIDDIIWTGNKPKIKELCELSGITEVLPMVKLYTILREASASDRAIHILPAYRFENKIKLLRLLNIRPDQISLKSSEELIKSVISQREIKSSEEVVEIEKAVNWSVDMHQAAITHLRPGMKEAEISSLVTKICLEREGFISFPVIATVKGEILHNHFHGNIAREGELFLLDCGAESPSHYAGDLTSTFPVSKKFTPIQKDIYQIVLDAHYGASALLKPGVPFKSVHMEASRIVFNGLKSLGLTKGNTEEAISEGAHALFFPTGLGHMMGLDVHDMEDLGEINVGYNGEAKSTQFGLKSLRLAKELKSGFVLTVEPGIYFIPELIALWSSEKRFEQFINYSKVNDLIGFGGIRIEQDYLITDNGFKLLGRKKPMDINEIEDLRNY